MTKENLKTKPFFLNEEQIKWVEDTLASLSLEEKVGQLFTLVGYTSDRETLLSYAQQYKAGGLMCRPMPSEEVAETVEILQTNSKVPMLIAANLENGGTGLAFDGTKVGCQMSIAAGKGKERAWDLGHVAGSEARALGCTWSFAPISDIDTNFRNPITNTRTYGSDEKIIEDCVVNYIKACEEQGVATATKHFPGDGQDEFDQHINLSSNDLSAEEWDKTYGKIYRAAIEAGTRTIMVGHIMQPAWTKKINPAMEDKDVLPASLSPEIVQGLLREHLGFNGLIVSDSTAMGGFSIAMERSKAVPRCIAAGIDVFLFTKNVEEDFGFMLQGVKDGIITLERLDEAVTRILALKASLHLHDSNIMPDLDKFKALVKEHKAKRYLEQVADESITLVKNLDNILPLSIEKHKRILFYPLVHKGEKVVDIYGGNDASTSKVVDELRKRGFEVTIFENRLNGLEGLMQPVNTIKDSYDLILYCASLTTKSNQTTIRIEWQQPMGINVPSLMHTIPTVFVSLENPYHLLDVPRVKTYINCYQSDDVVIKALVDKLLGLSEFKGQSPVDAFCGKWSARL